MSSVYGFIIAPHNDQLSVGLKAQLVEHCFNWHRRGQGLSPIQAFVSLLFK